MYRRLVWVIDGLKSRMSNVHQDFGCPKVSIRNRNAKENWVINVGEFVAHLLLMTWFMLPRRKRKENILVSR